MVRMELLEIRAKVCIVVDLLGSLVKQLPKMMVLFLHFCLLLCVVSRCLHLYQVSVSFVCPLVLMETLLSP